MFLTKNKSVFLPKITIYVILIKRKYQYLVFLVIFKNILS